MRKRPAALLVALALASTEAAAETVFHGLLQVEWADGCQFIRSGQDVRSVLHPASPGNIKTNAITIVYPDGARSYSTTNPLVSGKAVKVRGVGIGWSDFAWDRSVLKIETPNVDFAAFTAKTPTIRLKFSILYPENDPGIFGRPCKAIYAGVYYRNFD